jgi:hypothetical protein
MRVRLLVAVLFLLGRLRRPDRQRRRRDFFVFKLQTLDFRLAV